MTESITTRSQALEASLRWGGPGVTARAVVDAAGMFLDFLEGRPAPGVAGQIDALTPQELAALKNAPSGSIQLFPNGPAVGAAESDLHKTQFHPSNFSLIDQTPKRTRRTKAEMEAARVALAAATPEIEQAVQATTEPPAPAPAAEAPPPPPSTFADAKAALTRIVQTDGLGVPGGAEMLKAAGVARLSQLTEEQWAGFVAACEAKLKAHAT